MKNVIRTWLVGGVIFVAALAVGSLPNFKTQTISPTAIPEKHCQENRQDYIACGSDRQWGRFFVTGWPTRVYCYDSGKIVCSPWDDYVRVERFASQHQTQQKNLGATTLGAALISLAVVSITLSVERINLARKRNAHHRH